MTEKPSSPGRTPSDRARKARDTAPDDANARISRKLKALYDSVQEEAIPDRFLDLLERLDAADKASGHRGQGAGA